MNYDKVEFVENFSFLIIKVFLKNCILQKIKTQIIKYKIPTMSLKENFSKLVFEREIC